MIIVEYQHEILPDWQTVKNNEYLSAEMQVEILCHFTSLVIEDKLDQQTL